MSGILYVVGTPIGNLGDFSQRGIETLEKCDFIAAEDTRVTLKLLNRFGIKNTLVSYYEHNKLEHGQIILNRILNGENCALVTDAGMPAISDPGEDLVKLCLDNGIKIESVPGPCAFTTALAISGMPSQRFRFEGFPPVDSKQRKDFFDNIKEETGTVIIYEAPHKLGKALGGLWDNLGNRELAIVRELTKIHEEVIRTDLFTAKEKYGNNELKGEIVLIIHGKECSENKMTLDQAKIIALDLIESGKSKTDAAKEAAKITGIKKANIYKEII